MATKLLRVGWAGCLNPFGLEFNIRGHGAAAHGCRAVARACNVLLIGGVKHHMVLKRSVGTLAANIHFRVAAC